VFEMTTKETLSINAKNTWEKIWILYEVVERELKEAKEELLNGKWENALTELSQTATPMFELFLTVRELRNKIKYAKENKK